MAKIESLRTALRSSAIYGPLSRAYEELRSIFLSAGIFLPPRPGNELVGSAPDLPPKVSLIVATSTGLFKVEQREIRQVLRGEFYGITEHQGAWVVFEKCGKFGRLLSFSSTPASIATRRGDKSISISLGRLSGGIHQIDSTGKALLVADTYNNRILVASARDDGSRTFQVEKEIYPAGPLTSGRKSDNYVHLNSVFLDGGMLLVLFHNETAKTGKPSELCTYDFQGGVVKKRQGLDAGSGHNVLPWKGRVLCCDSLGGRLLWDDKPVFSADSFLRGLSITNDFIFLGGSPLAGRKDRRDSAGVVFVLSHEFDLLGEIEIPGAVHEIRSQSSPDYGLSRSASHGNTP